MILGVKDEQELRGMEQALSDRGIKFEFFAESHFNDQHTAVAINPMAPPELFQGMKLL